MPPKPEPEPERINNRSWRKPEWAGGKARKPGESWTYEDVLGSDGLRNARETLFEGCRAQDREQGRRLRDDNGHEVDVGAGDAGHAAGPLSPERIEFLKQTPRSMSKT